MRDVKKIAFLDRDGVVNIDHGYVFRVSDFQFTDGFFPACTMLAQAGYSFAIVTNQSGIARGYYTEAHLSTLNVWLTAQFKLHGLTLDAIDHCPHGPNDGCICRKPLPDMVNRRLAQTGALAKDCIMFGDKPSDEQCARAAGLGRFFMIDVNARSSHFYDTVFDFVSEKITHDIAPL